MAVAVEPIRPDNLTQNPYEVIPATIYETVEESPLIRTLRLRPEKPIKFHTGQFIELTIPGIGEGPFTPSSSHFISDVMDVTKHGGKNKLSLFGNILFDKVGLKDVDRGLHHLCGLQHKGKDHLAARQFVTDLRHGGHQYVIGDG